MKQNILALILALIAALPIRAQTDRLGAVEVNKVVTNSTITVSRSVVRQVSFGLTNGQFYAIAPYVWKDASGATLRQGNSHFSQAELQAALGDAAVAQCLSLTRMLPSPDAVGKIMLNPQGTIDVTINHVVESGGVTTRTSILVTETALRANGVDVASIKTWINGLIYASVR